MYGGLDVSTDGIGRAVLATKTNSTPTKVPLLADSGRNYPPRGPPLGFVFLRLRSDGTIVEYRASVQMQSAITDANAAVRSISQLFPVDLAATLLALLLECIATQSVVTRSYTVGVVDGIRVRQACFAPASVDEVVGIISDVTSDRAADARRVHLAEILEASTDYVATTDLNGRILYANHAFRERFGVDSVQEIITESYSLFSFMSKESRQRFIADGVPELWRTGRWSGEIEAQAADGSLVPLWQAAIVHRNAAGEPEYVSGISRDIADMKEAQSALSQSEGRFRALLAEGSDVILILSIEGLITFASPAIERLLGYAVDSLVGTLAFDLIHPDDLSTAMSAFVAAYTGDNSADGLQYRVRHADQSWRWVESHTANHLNTPGIDGFIVNARDITARHNANDRIQEASELLASVMGAAANEAIFVTDNTATIVAFSRGAEVLLGYTAAEVVGVVHPRVFHIAAEVDAAAAELAISVDALFLHPPPDGHSIIREWVFVRRDGSTFDGALTVSARFDSVGVLCGFLYVARDISERLRHDEDLIRQARHDPLTGLSNRSALNEALHDALDGNAWSDLGRILLFIDLDHFKAVNDTYGHAAGDCVLVGVSQRLAANLRAGDLAVRLGGDEFVVLLGPNVSSESALDIADRIVAALAEPFIVNGCPVVIGASVGLATSGHGLTAEALLLAADGAAYTAKSEGRGRVVQASTATDDAEP